MKICPVCSTEYPDDVKFCPNDGQTLRSAAPASDLVGQIVADRYHVVKKLGEGGMGQVYLAEHVKMGRRSAIKVMNPSMVHDPDAVARFNREAANASRINHANVCAIYDFGETPDADFPPDCRRAPGRARPRHRAPRSQAGQHHGVQPQERRRYGEGRRLRDRQGGWG